MAQPEESTKRDLTSDVRAQQETRDKEIANAGWSRLQPAVLPRPGYCPAVLAFGIVFAVWGLIASPILSLAGLALIVVGLIGWIGELLHEGRTEGHDDRQS